MTTPPTEHLCVECGGGGPLGHDCLCAACRTKFARMPYLRTVTLDVGLMRIALGAYDEADAALGKGYPATFGGAMKRREDEAKRLDATVTLTNLMRDTLRAGEAPNTPDLLLASKVGAALAQAFGRDVYYHGKTGRLYQLQGVGTASGNFEEGALIAELAEVKDTVEKGERIIFYRTLDTHDLYARPERTFRDGRFVSVTELFKGSQYE